VDESRRSTSYERRLLKYAQRGFAIAVPGLSRPAMGLATPTLGRFLHPPSCNTHSSMGCVCGLLRYDTKKSLTRQRDGIPHNSQWYEKRFGRVSSLTAYVKISPTHYVQAPREDKQLHTFKDGSRLFMGTIKSALGDVAEMGGKIRFITDQPGRQLLSGSFHPVNDDNWDHGVLTRPLLSSWRYDQPDDAKHSTKVDVDEKQADKSVTNVDAATAKLFAVNICTMLPPLLVVSSRTDWSFVSIIVNIK
jgi:hypothetical protein